MTNAPLCALAHLMNALLAGFFELMALFSAILAFLSSCDIILMFETFRLQRYKKVCEKRGIWALKVTEGGCFFVTFVFFLMGIVPNNHQNSYNNETIIIDCVGLGGAGADGM